MSELLGSYEALIRAAIVKDRNYPTDAVLRTLKAIEEQLANDERITGSDRKRLFKTISYWRKVVS